MSTKLETSFNLLENFSINANVNLKHSINTNVTEILSNYSGAKVDKKAVVLFAKYYESSLSTRINILKEICETTEMGKKLMNSHLLTIADFTVPALLNTLSTVYLSDNTFFDFKVIPINPKTEIFILPENFDKIKFAITDNGYLLRTENNQLQLTKDNKFFTIKKVEKCTFDQIIANLVKYKKAILFNKVAEIKNSHKTAIDIEKDKKASDAKISKDLKIETAKNEEIEKESKRIETEKANLLKIEKLEKQVEKLKAQKVE